VSAIIYEMDISSRSSLLSSNRAFLLEKVSKNIIKVANYVSMFMLLILMLLGSVDVIGRYVFNKPIQASFELNQILLAGVVFFGLAYTQLVGGHIKVEFLVSRFKPRMQAITDFITLCLMLGLFSLITWQSLRIAIVFWQQNKLIDVLFVNMAFFQSFVTVAAFLMSIELIIQLVHCVIQMRE
jgi:C4-dicarboxylate transporter DctQ subunit